MQQHRRLFVLMAAFMAGPAMLVLPPVSAAETGHAQNAPIDGAWDATVQLKDGTIPFRLEIGGPANAITVTYFDGERPVHMSTGGHFANGSLAVEFASFATKLEAQLDHGVLRGSVSDLPFEAHRHHRETAPAAKAPTIGGIWEVPIDSNKGEKAWRLIVEEKPTGVYATILRIDGDTGTISGSYDGAKFNLSRFAGERPMSLQITPQTDGRLALVLIDQFGRRELTAVRPAAARQAGLAAPDDPQQHTRVDNSAEPFHFSGTDLEGKTVSSSDALFKGKVVLVNVMGSWCPNCHDEAPFLAELDAKYRDKGLQVVSLDFEDPEALKTLSRVKAFVARYGLRYSMLVAGERSQVNEKLPQAVNLNAWPTTFFLGRDGKARSVHVGFPSHGSGEYDRQARADMTHEVERLLAEQE